MAEAANEALLEAAKVADAAAARAALDAGAAVNCEDAVGAMPLHWAAENGHAAVAALLLERGADLNATTGTEGVTPLHCAARMGHADVVALLTQRGADLNATDQDGATPLISAAKSGFTAIVALLADAGANLDAADVGDGTALHWAASNDHPAAALLLIERGTAVEDRGDPTPLALAVRHAMVEVCFRLLWRGADVARVTGVDMALSTALIPQLSTPADWAVRSVVAAALSQLLAAWRRGELRSWRQDTHALFPAAFRADVRALLLATLGSVDAPAEAGAAPRHNPLRQLREQHLLELLLSALLLAHMGGPALPTLVQPPAPPLVLPPWWPFGGNE